jgi:hypothetical protein
MTALVTHRRLAAWGLLVALLAGVAAALGVFARGDGAFVTVTSARGETYDMATTGVYANNALEVVAEGVGWDVFTLAVAVPALVIAAAFVASGSFRGLLVLAGLFGYFLYLHLEYAVTWALGPLFPLFVATVAASGIGLVGAAIGLVNDDLASRFAPTFPRRTWAGLSLGMSVLLLALWTARIAEGLAASPPPLLGETTMTVQALDLGLVVPISFVIAVAALRRNPAGLAAATAFAVTFVAMSAAIAAMMVSSWIVTGVSALPPVMVFGAAALVGLWVAWRMVGSVVVAADAANTGAAADLQRAGSRAG